jgi:hypothetical protein
MPLVAALAEPNAASCWRKPSMAAPGSSASPKMILL